MIINFKSHKNILAILLLFFSSVLFTMKYSHIYFNDFYLIPIIYSVLFIAFISFFSIYSGKHEIREISVKILFWAFIASSLLIILLIDRQGNVNRLPAIEDWWYLFNQNIFPYKSELTPSSFPALFFISLPFNMINKLDLLEIIGFAIFLYVLYSINKSTKLNLLVFIIFVISPITIYELVVRCELFFNTSLVILFIYITEKFNIEKSKLSFLLTAIMLGIVMSTRSAVVIPITIYVIYKFRSNFSKLFLFGIIGFIVFSLTLLPFIIWDSSAFVQFGPFAIQSKLSNVPFWLTIIFILLSVFAGWSATNIKEVFFSSGVFLFLIVGISYLIKINDFGAQIAFYEDKIDLSYLAFSFPFLLLSISNDTFHKFLGKLIKE